MEKNYDENTTGRCVFCTVGSGSRFRTGRYTPVLIIQNDVGNQYSPTTIVAAITGQMCKAKLPTHVDLAGRENGLSKNSVVLVEQVRTIDKQRLKERICTLDKAVMEQVDQALEISMGLRSPFVKEEEMSIE